MNNSVSLESNSEDEDITKISYGMSPAILHLWNTLFTTILFSSILGNLIVLWIVLAHRRMWSITNYFLVNMSLADLLMTVFNTTFNFVHMRDKDWPFGSLYCSINNFVSNLTVTASVINLCAMTLDRYKAIVYPLKPKNTRCCVLTTILGIWIGSAVFSLPALLFSKTYQMRGGKTSCFIHWPDGYPGFSYLDYVYNVIFFLITYLGPILVMGFCYTHMGNVLWRKSDIGESSDQQSRVHASKQKIVKMLFGVFLIFSICWLPYQLYFIYTYYNPKIVSLPYIQHVYLSFYWLAMGNAVVNPIIYYCLNARFRSYFNDILTLRFIRTMLTQRLMVSGPILNTTAHTNSTNAHQRYSTYHVRRISIHLPEKK
nr:tachykinin-like peptides receptor 86C isoform X2 [Lepeophtheirus salmonis]